MALKSIKNLKFAKKEETKTKFNCFNCQKELKTGDFFYLPMEDRQFCVSCYFLIVKPKDIYQIEEIK